MKIPPIRGRLCGIVVAATVGLAISAGEVRAFFPQSQPPFPPVAEPPTGVEPLPPIIVPDPPPPVHSTPEPGTMALALIGAGIAGAIAKRRRAPSGQLEEVV
jgi:hypothetical protein